MILYVVEKAEKKIFKLFPPEIASYWFLGKDSTLECVEICFKSSKMSNENSKPWFQKKKKTVQRKESLKLMREDCHSIPLISKSGLRYNDE